MVAITLADCNVMNDGGEILTTTIITPSTADSTNTIDITDICADGQLLGIKSSWDIETGDAVTCTYDVSTGYLLLDNSGATSNHTYCIVIMIRGSVFTP